MLLDVFTRVASDTGYNVTQQRAALLNLLNNAAREMYDSLECNHIYREVTLVVPRDKLVSLPSIIGDIRGMRAHTDDSPFPLQSLSAPRYVDERWNYKIRNWRELGHSPVHTFVAAIGVLTVECPVIDDGATLLIAGQTPNAERTTESVVLTSTPQATVAQFGPSIFMIACAQERSCNITIKDVQENEIAVLYNTENETRYLIVDVSEVFWSIDTQSDETLIDVAYKHPLWRLTSDTDVFPAGSRYDNAWYHLAMSKYFAPMENRKNDAASERALYTVAMIEAKGGAEQNIEKRISFGRNRFYNLFRRGRIITGSCTNVDTSPGV